MLKMINRLITPDSGEILIDSKNIEDMDLIKLRCSIGYSIQGTMLFPHLTVGENISYVPDLIEEDKKRDRKYRKGKKVEFKRSKDEKAEDEANEIEKNKRISQWLKIVGLDESILNRFPHELSGGQKQRVGIARALAASPKILLMDEPFGAVDEITRRQLQEEIKRIHRETGITIIFVTHDIGEALYLGDHVIVMDEGRINQYGKPEDILNNPATPFVEKLCERTKLVVNNKD